MTGLESSVSAILSTSASTASVTSPANSSSNRLPWRTSVTPWKPSRGSAPSTALPWGSRISGLGMTSTTTRATGALLRKGCECVASLVARPHPSARGCAPPTVGHTGPMSMPAGPPGANALRLEFPQSLAVYDDYAAAQKAVDFLSDNKFPVEHLMIVGTDLKRVERITGRLTTGRVALGGVLSGLWLGLFVGLIFSFFVNDSILTMILSTMVLGAVFGVIWALLGYALTRGQRDFSS